MDGPQGVGVWVGKRADERLFGKAVATFAGASAPAPGVGSSPVVSVRFVVSGKVHDVHAAGTAGELLSAMGIQPDVDRRRVAPITQTPLHVPLGYSATVWSMSDHRRSSPVQIMGFGRVREIAARHGIRPSKAMGQHFLIDPNLARAIAADTGARPGDRVIEVGAGLGSLTVALADTGADVLALEFDRALLPALAEAVRDRPNVRVRQADATKLDWKREVGEWPTLVANLPYNIATALVVRVLEEAPAIGQLVVMVQREVGDRFLAGPGDPGYGPLSLRVKQRARASLLRRVPLEVFWPRPAVASVVVRLERRPKLLVEVDEARLWSVVEAAFGGRRKTLRSALAQLGATGLTFDAAGIDPRARADELTLEELARIAEALPV